MYLISYSTCIFFLLDMHLFSYSTFTLFPIQYASFSYSTCLFFPIRHVSYFLFDMHLISYLTCILFPYFNSIFLKTKRSKPTNENETETSNHALNVSSTSCMKYILFNFQRKVFEF